MMRLILPTLLLALCAATIQPASAGEIVAIVEQSEGDTGDVRMFDMLEAGQVIEIGSGGRLVLGYLRSCWRETIAGGDVTIGPEQSNVKFGRIFRELVECDGGSLQLSAALSNKSSAMAYRTPPGEDASAPPQVILFSLTPAFRVSNDAVQVNVERLDKAAPLLAVKTKRGSADMAQTALRLKPGGHYRATAGDARATFAIDPLAIDAGGALIGRVVFLAP
ncbi:MAG: hypothetical protein HOM52_16795 [Rhodospirillaceae bacterium]|nr:hypothetical protein [Rhodospirillaceae bacterium]